MKHIIAFSTIALIFFSACSPKKEPVAENKKFVLSDTMMNMIRIDTVGMCHIGDEVSLSGQVSFNENNVVKIFPSTSGQVVSVNVSLGDHVTKGQLLAMVKSADIAGDYSDLKSAGADVAIAKRELDNTEALYKNGISSEKDYITAKQNYEKALSGRNKIQSTININGGARPNASGQYALISPIDGYIVEKKVTGGSFIRPDMGDYLFSISNLKTIWIYANIYESDIPRVREGYPVKVSTLAYPDRVFDGKIDKISQVLDSNSKALRARVTLDNNDMSLRPQMFAKIIVSNQEGQEALCIPTDALIMLNGKYFVVIYNGKDDIKNQEVDILKTVGSHTYLNGGLQSGQKLITRNQLLVFNQLISSE